MTTHRVDIPTGNTGHPVTQQHDHQGLVRWTCPACDWATPWGRPGNASHGAAAVRHAAGMAPGGPVPAHKYRTSTRDPETTNPP